MKLIVITFLTSLLVACSERRNHSGKEASVVPERPTVATNDPKGSFEGMLAKLRADADTWDQVRYDIRATDSLVTPYRAELAVTFWHVRDFVGTDYLAAFLYRENRWEMKSLKVTLRNKEMGEWHVVSEKETGPTSTQWELLEGALGAGK